MDKSYVFNKGLEITFKAGAIIGGLGAIVSAAEENFTAGVITGAGSLLAGYIGQRIGKKNKSDARLNNPEYISERTNVRELY
ncbi:MAG: hypothetical protein KC506_02930 [Nanoarchaeota archaeon]|nr:hypothetical protein [Nanoarchaeota archaeon]